MNRAEVTSLIWSAVDRMHAEYRRQGSSQDASAVLAALRLAQKHVERAIKAMDLRDVLGDEVAREAADALLNGSMTASTHVVALLEMLLEDAKAGDVRPAGMQTLVVDGMGRPAARR